MQLNAPSDAADLFDESSADDAGLLAALATLNPRYQKAISLRYLAGLTHAEAAEAMSATKPVMAVTARYRGQTVKLAWSAYSGDDFAAYLVLRSDSPAEPQYPVDEHTTVVARITDRFTLSTLDTIAEPGARLYRVVAVNMDRRLVARSLAARPQPAM